MKNTGFFGSLSGWNQIWQGSCTLRFIHKSDPFISVTISIVYIMGGDLYFILYNVRQRRKLPNFLPFLTVLHCIANARPLWKSREGTHTLGIHELRYRRLWQGSLRASMEEDKEFRYWSEMKRYRFSIGVGDKGAPPDRCKGPLEGRRRKETHHGAQQTLPSTGDNSLRAYLLENSFRHPISPTTDL